MIEYAEVLRKVKDQREALELLRKMIVNYANTKFAISFSVKISNLHNANVQVKPPDGIMVYIPINGEFSGYYRGADPYEVLLLIDLALVSFEKSFESKELQKEIAKIKLGGKNESK